MNNIVNFPIIPRATAITPSANDDRDPHTVAIEMMKKAIQFSTQTCGKAWTLNVLKSAIEVDDQNGWRDRARKLFQGSENT
jgi:hypothetical protein